MQSYFLTISHFMLEMDKIKEKQVGSKLKITYMLGVIPFLKFILFYLVYLFKWLASLLILDLFKMANAADDGYRNSTQ